jgi:hypothetical protein
MHTTGAVQWGPSEGIVDRDPFQILDVGLHECRSKKLDQEYEEQLQLLQAARKLEGTEVREGEEGKEGKDGGEETREGEEEAEDADLPMMYT